ncbi:MAG: DMT family transporter [Mogibacterium sp.]|nr:DMT family transporter [Mogibacterium sp.]
MSNKNKGNLILLLTAILWGTGFISQKLGNRVMPPMTFNAVRQLMAAVVLTPLVLYGLKKSGYLSRESNMYSQLADRKKRLLKGGVLCGLFMLIGTATQQIGLLTVSAGKSGFISSIYIVFTPLFSVIVGSKVKRRTVICIAIAMMGFAVMSLKGGISGATPGDWLTLASAAGFAAQIVAVNCFVDKDNAVLLSQLQFLFCGAAGLVVALIMEGPAWAGVLAGIPILLYQTFVPTTGGYTLQIIGQKYTDSSTAALIMSTEAIFAMIFGAIFLREMMSMREIAGAAIIFAATILGQIE